MNIQEHTVSARQTTITGLAVVGFIMLVIVGIVLAMYSTRFVPGLIGNIGSAAVYVGSVFTPSSAPTLAVVPTATSSVADLIITFGDEQPVDTIPKKDVPIVTPRQPVLPTPGPATSETFPIDGNAGAATLSGLPDLIVSINAIGYLASASAESFLASSTVPFGNRPAVKFTIKNVGTNVSGSWRFSASIPTQSGYIYQSQLQQSLGPGDSIEYTLGFDQANPGTQKMISVTANFDHSVGESNSNNNSASAILTILGS